MTTAAETPPTDTAPIEDAAAEAAAAAEQAGQAAANVRQEVERAQDAGLLDGANEIKEAVAEQSVTVASVIE